MNTYNADAKRLEALYEKMVANLNSDHSYENFTRYSKHHTNSDWFDCNSVDRMDGSKYIGYTRREREDSRFGSFPVHDDYGDESWADENPGNEY
ncbi:hypothetical protein [Brunnivagina elsteri]|uniref:Uncharacterized protein n=1 Tax=Brunnivagina elsteri CCALA 953 TaxID=987040 RepID=A0A2A2TKK6_9CYAN|nr:hypothetical protein [Calothrix elsteri]PAX57190.1 hypothetical protein CK510_09110 [Calothrix elsteri CCALA 953]